MKRDISVVGIDIAKRVFPLVGMDARGKIVMRKRCSRGEVLPLRANLGPVTIGMEACGGAHYWARHLREQGHEVKLMAPQAAPTKFEAKCVTSGTHRWAVLDAP
jgi:transposase